MRLSSGLRCKSYRSHSSRYTVGERILTVNSDGEELPRAYIMPSTPDKATPEVAEGIKRWLAERVSKAKRLEGGVLFLDAIPKNPSGKILRKQLREMAAKENPRAKL